MLINDRRPLQPGVLLGVAALAGACLENQVRPRYFPRCAPTLQQLWLGAFLRAVTFVYLDTFSSVLRNPA